MKFTQRTQSSHELYLFSIELACITVNNRFCFFVCSLDFVFLLFFFCFYETMFLLTLFALLMAGDIVLIMQRKARH